MRTLLDTCVLSELARPEGSSAVRAFVESLGPDDAHLSAITIGELVNGAARAPRGRRRDRIEAWIRTVEDDFADRVLPVDHRVARTWGLIDAQVRSRGWTLSLADGLIAATALVHDLRLATRNLRDFEPTGARVEDPWTTGRGDGPRH